MQSTDTELVRPRPRSRSWFAWAPAADAAWAAASVILFWLVYLSGSTVGYPVMLAGIIVVGTILPAYAVFRVLRGGWADLGVTAHRWKTSLAVSAFLGFGSAYQVFALAADQDVDPVPHLLANLLVLWEPLFLCGWLYLAWERAFGIVPALVLVGVGFVLQHVGSVPFEVALGFGAFGIFFAAVFAITRNLLILWPLAYGTGSAIGTLQSDLAFGWPSVASGALLLAAQVAVLLVLHRMWTGAPRVSDVPTDPADSRSARSAGRSR